VQPTADKKAAKSTAKSMKKVSQCHEASQDDATLDEWARGELVHLDNFLEQLVVCPSAFISFL
jgi:hypothetical protein